MALDKKLIGQVKQACLNAKKAGIDTDLLKLAFRGRPILQRPIFQRRQPVYQQPVAPAPAPAAPAAPAQQPYDAYGQGPLPSEDTAASKAMWQPAPQGMQRFRHSQTGEVFYAPDQNAANSYIAGGDAGSLGIKPGQRVDAGYRQQMEASQARAQAPGGMDNAIAEARKIRAQMEAEQARKLTGSQIHPPIKGMGVPSLKSTQLHPPIPNMGQPAPLSLSSTQVSPAIRGMGVSPPIAPPKPTQLRSLISSKKPAAPPPQMPAGYQPMPEINTGG